MSYQSLVNKFNYVYTDLWEEYGAKEVKSLPLLSDGPWQVIFMVLVYLWFVKYKGPEIMKNREPINIKPFILIYNSFLVILHVFAFPVAIYSSNFFKTCWQCKRIDLVNGDPFVENSLLLLGYIYFLTKFIELLDTVFFVLRKKTQHVSGLHVFHHASMPIFCYIGGKFSPWYPLGWIAILNAFVHIVMYSYYTAALLEIKRFLWIKKYITQLQIVQFLLILAHAVYFINLKDCAWPKIFPYMQLVHGIQFLYLFSSFYVRTYWKKPNAKSKTN